MEQIEERLDPFKARVERAAQALAFDQHPFDVAYKLARSEEIPISDAYLIVRAAEIWMKDK